MLCEHSVFIWARRVSLKIEKPCACPNENATETELQ